MSMKQPDLRKKLSEYFASRKDVAFAYLFGSSASGRATVESDVDIAVYLLDTHATRRGTDPTRGQGHRLPDIEETDVHFASEDEIWADVERICESQVDLVVFNRATATVAAAAMLTGTLVHSADEALRTTFFLTITNLAQDEREFSDDFVRVKERSRSLSEIDRSRLVRIIDFLKDELEDAAQFDEMDMERYSTDRDFRRSVERWVENLVNASIDAAKIVLASERRPVPHTYRETVEMLATVEGFGEHEGLARRLASNTRVRNMLAHEYLDLRYTRVNAVVDHAADTYGTLVAALRVWMS